MKITTQKELHLTLMCQNPIKKIPTFDLTINLVEKELWKIKEEDEDILDLPVAYLTYDSRKGIWFDRNQQYSRVINKKMKSFGIY